MLKSTKDYFFAKKGLQVEKQVFIIHFTTSCDGCSEYLIRSIFDTFNFKLAVINELMYELEILKPYFDIYEFMEFKKTHWDLETGENVEVAVQFFRDLPIPVTDADKVTTIYMDGGNEIYLNIAPLWDGEDDRFDIDNLTERELRQFPNLKSMTVITTELEKLQKICGNCGIEVSAL